MKAVALACLLLVAVAAPAAGESNGGLTDSEVVVKTDGPHRLLLPRDWPIEHKDGRIAPVSIEIYMSMKFEQVGKVLERLDRRVAALEAGMVAAQEVQRAQALRLKLLEESAQQGGE